ncbi:MAG: phosphatidylglycerophosphatase A [Acidimicrobiia bacterium]|nr:phosphatidylglycerophosphatase A [Acidimicrobiia bacterium]
MRRLFASSFGLGLVLRRLRGSDSGSGTMGALLGVGIAAALLVTEAPWWMSLLAAAAAITVSLWSAAPFADGDPGWVCIDETAGTLVAVIGLGGLPWLVAIGVARLADIFKVLPGVAAAESLPGAIGITADDVIAGCYGLGIGWGLTALGVL